MAFDVGEGTSVLSPMCFDEGMPDHTCCSQQKNLSKPEASQVVINGDTDWMYASGFVPPVKMTIDLGCLHPF